MGFSHVIPELIKKMSKTRKGKKNKISVFSPGHKRAFCFIDDAVDQIIKLSFNNKNK